MPISNQPSEMSSEFQVGLDLTNGQSRTESNSIYSEQSNDSPSVNKDADNGSTNGAEPAETANLIPTNELIESRDQSDHETVVVKKEPDSDSGCIEDINGNNSYETPLAVSVEVDYSPGPDSYSPGDSTFSGDVSSDLGGEFTPAFDPDGQQIIEVDCGNNRAHLYLDKLCQGSKGKCILFQNEWHTPNEFQSVSGRETAKDWKRSIRHRGKSLKILMARGLLKAHPMMCECQTCKNNMCRNNFSLLTDSKHKKTGWANGSTKAKKLKSHHQLDDMAVDHYIDYSMKKTGTKRARSASPIDDIYDEQQRKIFQAANSPEPQNIENMQRSFNMETSPNMPSSPQGGRLSMESQQASPSPSPSGVILAMHPQMMFTKTQVKNRKQSTPQHLLVPTSSSEANESSRVPHIQLMPVPSHSSKAQASIRPRYHQGSRSVTIPPGPSSAGVLDTSVAARRARSLMTPSTKSPGFNAMRMIELTRPSTSKGEPSTPVTLNGHETFRGGPAPSTAESVFLSSSDMSSWGVEDVVDFVQGLKGCEEYGQTFRDQAIDGEILPILTEEHLLNTMGLKLGPALKIRLHVARKLGYFLDGQYHIPKQESTFEEN